MAAQNGGADSGSILQEAERQLLDQEDQALNTNKVFQKKEVKQKRFLPNIKNYNVLGETRLLSFSSATYLDFKDIRSRCLAEGKLFEDPEFPANDHSLYYKQKFKKPITWLRPSEICDHPQLFVKGYSRFDVHQGELGDCWFLAAVANLTLHQKLFLQVVPDDQSFDEDYAGVFHFRFWQYGIWVDVVIDDRLPTCGKQLAFVRSSVKNEFWSALLEKAYAKLHGSYEALRRGSICEAMEDFTGGLAEVYELTKLPPNFYTILLKAHERNSLIGCTVIPDAHKESLTPAGLVRGHVYSVTRVKYVDIKTPGGARRIPLLRLRNPWGNQTEWNGSWSDKSPEWRNIPQSEKDELGLTFDHDGEFWMSFEDFVSHLTKVQICNLNPESLNPEECPEGCTKKWEMSIFDGEWVKGVTAGGCKKYLETFWRNPQYTVTLKDPDDDDEENKCTIIVALMQKNRRSQRHLGLKNLRIGFAVYRLPDNGHVPKPLDVYFFKDNASVGQSQGFVPDREVSARTNADSQDRLLQRYQAERAIYNSGGNARAPLLFLQVVPDDQSFDEDYAGVFHFRFWQYGRWVDVVIDDRLPTYSKQLAFLHSSVKNEFWSALLEKAYAKLHGSYEALRRGSICEAMEDFTGGLAEVYELTKLPPNFYTILIKAHERNSLIGCTVIPDVHKESLTPAGLVRGHVYSVTRVKYVDIKTPGGARRIPLLRLRNPWGNQTEWNGSWSDKSPEWRNIPQSEKDELGLTFDHDGEFWMSFEDFVSHLTKVQICNLNPESLNPEECPEGCTKKWEMSIFDGEWVKGVTAGGCKKYLETFWRNPQYTVTLKDPDDDDEENKCTIIVALMQKNRRSQRHLGLKNLRIGFAVYRLPDNGHVPKPLDVYFFKDNASVGQSQGFVPDREVSARFKFDPGNYVIIPSTFDPNDEGEFLLRVFSEKDNNMAENDEEMGMGDVDVRVKEIASNPEPAGSMHDFFNRFAGEDGEVDLKKIKDILDYALRDELKGQRLSKEVCSSVVAMLNKDGSGGLGFDEFKTLWIDLRNWRVVFRLYDVEGRGAIPAHSLRDALNSAGYTVNAHVLNILARRYGSSDGCIQFDDFIMCAVRLKTMIDTLS